jgi:hypothetical protein
VFSIFFLYSLFNRILLFAKEKGYKYSYSSVLLFISFIITVLIGNLLEKLPGPFGLISLLGIIFLIPPFKALNFAKQNSTEFIVTKQTSFSKRQIALIVLGVIYWGLVLLGMIVEYMS